MSTKTIARTRRATDAIFVLQLIHDMGALIDAGGEVPYEKFFELSTVLQMTIRGEGAHKECQEIERLFKRFRKARLSRSAKEATRESLLDRLREMRNYHYSLPQYKAAVEPVGGEATRLQF